MANKRDGSIVGPPLEQATSTVSRDRGGRIQDAANSVRDRSSSTARSLTGEKSVSPPQLDTARAAETNRVHPDASAPTTTNDPVAEAEGADNSQAPSHQGRRISFAGMDDVDLRGERESSRPASPQRAVIPQPSEHRTAIETPSDDTSSPSSFKTASPPPIPVHPAPPTRKITSPFTWLSRNSSRPEIKPTSPPPMAASSPRKLSTLSLSSITNSFDFMSGKNDDDGTTELRSAKRNSLKDRFKLLRMREEAGIEIPEDDKAFRLTSPTGVPRDEGGESGPAATTSTVTSPGPAPLARRPTINPNLAPGTAAGLAEGPTDSADVDWNLWQDIVCGGPSAVARSSSEELNRAIASGIPQAIRGVVWQVLAESKNEELEAVYQELVVKGTDKERRDLTEGRSSVNGAPREKDSVRSSASSVHSDYSTPATSATTNGTKAPTSPAHSIDGGNDETPVKTRPSSITDKRKKSVIDPEQIRKLEKTIKRDLGARTSYSKYVMAAGLQDGLFGVCKAYALHDEAVGYAQGMNFIAMPLLFNMPEEEAFCLLVKLMDKYNLRDMFIQDMPGLHLHLYQFERLLEDFEPALYCHLHRRGVAPNLYATQWFLTLFAYRFPLQLVLRIYDLILSEGLSAILKFGIILMQKNKEALLGMNDMSQLTNFLKEKLFDVYIDKAPSTNSLLESGFFGTTGGIDKEVYRADTLVQDACNVKITSEILASYSAEWKEKTRLEKEREAELEDLRSQVNKLTLKVRTLENTAEKSDIEHVQAASDLVRLKVQNDDLQDENETLKGQVEEVRKLVDTQAAEVEQRLRSEMDTVMQRNSEVHNANRALEEQLGEMERELVDTKLHFAQTTSEFDAMKQRWNNIASMINSK